MTKQGEDTKTDKERELEGLVGRVLLVRQGKPASHSHNSARPPPQCPEWAPLGLHDPESCDGKRQASGALYLPLSDTMQSLL